MTSDLNTFVGLVALALFFVFAALYAFPVVGSPTWLVRLVRSSRVFRVIVRRNHSLRKWFWIVWSLHMVLYFGYHMARAFA